MPSFNIHLAVAIKYCEKNVIKNKDDFFKGSIAPDLVKDKSITHYTGFKDTSNLKRYLKEKVRLNEYLKNEKIDSDYKSGEFLHLVTDYIFFNELFEEEYIENVTYKEFVQDLYYSYNITNKYLEKQYDIHSLNLDDIMNNNIKDALKNKKVDNTVGKNILPVEKLEEFIETMSNLDIKKYIEKIKKENKNVFP